MSYSEKNKPVYDLEERTYLFAKDIRLLIKTLPQSIANVEDSKQLVRSSGSIGANYREANFSPAYFIALKHRAANHFLSNYCLLLVIKHLFYKIYCSICFYGKKNSKRGK